MRFWEDLVARGAPYWIDVGCVLVLLSVIIFLMYKYAKNRRTVILFVFGVAAFLSAYVFLGGLLTTVIGALLAFGMAYFLVINFTDFRPLLGHGGRGRGKSGKNDVQKIFDREALYDSINEAVSFLSRTKTGAIMTFERKMPLNDMIKNGVAINAPVTPELLMTIFYPGTRLHDGAVVIRDNLIIVASAFYTPTTKPLAGKYGSRHRAAIGISEVSDSVTVVVSEETGRISIAYGGELEPVFIDNFHRVFEEYMEDSTYVEEKESV